MPAPPLSGQDTDWDTDLEMSDGQTDELPSGLFAERDDYEGMRLEHA